LLASTSQQKNFIIFRTLYSLKRPDFIDILD
jgi:hypothetical protein